MKTLSKLTMMLLVAASMLATSCGKEPSNEANDNTYPVTEDNLVGTLVFSEAPTVYFGEHLVLNSDHTMKLGADTYWDLGDYNWTLDGNRVTAVRSYAYTFNGHDEIYTEIVVLDIDSIYNVKRDWTETPWLHMALQATMSYIRNDDDERVKQNFTGILWKQ